MQLFLTGFMGSGKSTIVDRIMKSGVCEVECLETDDLILKKYSNFDRLGDLISEIGFSKFREEELVAIKSLSEDGADDRIVAIGGGALTAKSFEIIKNSGGVLFFLNTPFSECLKRIQGDNNRPLASKSEDELRVLYDERLKIFRMADISLDVGDQEQIKLPEDLFKYVE